MATGVVVAGGTGLLGRALVAALAARGEVVTVMTRNPGQARLPRGARALGWDQLGQALDSAAAIVNLAGEGIADRRWSPARKALLRSSRLGATAALVQAVAAQTARPATLINASAVGYYGPCDEGPVDEAAPQGTGFLADLCQAWEAEAGRATDLGLRVVPLRLGVILAREGGALPRMALPVKLGLGAPLGHGRQGLSWIHIQDAVALILAALDDGAYAGPLNATAPEPLSNAAFTCALGRALHRPVLPVPAFATRSALRLLVGEMAEEMLLSGAYVLPRKAQAQGFTFRFPTLEAALADLIP